MHASRLLSAAMVVGMAVACGGEPPAETEAPAEIIAPTSSCFVASGTLEEAKGRPSPLTEATFSVGGSAGTLCYGAPSANGRQIMGGLVPFGEMWRLGANEATALHLTGPASVGGVELQAGSYSLYAIPGETEWTFFLNTDVNRWGIPLDDAVRTTEVGSFTAAVEALDAPVEALTFRFEPSADGPMGDLVLEWENTRVKIQLQPLG